MQIHTHKKKKIEPNSVTRRSQVGSTRQIATTRAERLFFNFLGATTDQILPLLRDSVSHFFFPSYFPFSFSFLSDSVFVFAWASLLTSHIWRRGGRGVGGGEGEGLRSKITRLEGGDEHSCRSRHACLEGEGNWCTRKESLVFLFYNLGIWPRSTCGFSGNF